MAKRDLMGTPMYVVGGLIVLVCAVGVRYLMAGGNWACVMAADPVLCNTVHMLQ